MITGKILRDAIISGANAIINNKTKVDELNVFPVPDGDTGTNMSMTIGAAKKELVNLPDDCTVEQVTATTASCMLRGARGNSGVISSLLFRGFSKALKGKITADAADLTAALRKGVDSAYKAVMKPTEGTILTVAREACEKAESMNETDEAKLWEAVVEAAKVSLANTPELLPVLKKAGVVDAGGQGVVYIFEGMLKVFRGEEMVAAEEAVKTVSTTDFSKKGVYSEELDAEITNGYCTEFIVNKNENASAEKLRAYLESIGDSVVVVEDEQIIKSHVHTADPGKALSEAVKYGSFVTVKIENMRLQHTEKVMSEQELAPKIAEPEKALGVVSVCAGDGLADVFMNLGVDGIISGGQTMNPSTQDILEAVNKVPAETVFVLPNNKNIIMAAQQVAGLTPKNVVVIPSKTVPQGITAMLSFNPDGSVEENTEALTEALGMVDTMQITYAARNSDFDGYLIHEGDYLAIAGSGLFGTSRDIKVLLRSLAEKVRDDGREYITIYYGEDIQEKHAQKAADLFAEFCPDADVNLIRGGQPVYYYLISAE